MALDILITIILGFFTIVVTIGLFLVRNIRTDVRAMQTEMLATSKEIHQYMVTTERRLTMLEGKVFGFKEQ